MVKRFLLTVLSLLLLSPALYAAAAPFIAFTDITSGPNSGGENNNGAILTIYGYNFGGSQGGSTVTVGGGAVAAYLSWGSTAPGEVGLQKISVAIGSLAATGNVVVTVGGQSSNSVTFTVRTGNISCVSTGGSDSNNGQFSTDTSSRAGTKGCWATIPHAQSTMAAGDITYIENGVSATGSDGNSASVSLTTAGTSGNPKALIAYPGATVTVGTSSVSRGFYIPSGNSITQWVIAGLQIVSHTEAFVVNDGTFIWFEGNDVQCPTGASDTGCILGDSSGSNNLHFLGNYLHNIGTGGCGGGGNCHTYQALYVSTNGHSWEAGWNTIVPDPSGTGVGGCKGIEVYSTGGSDEYDVHIHDNIIHNVICDGIAMEQVNPDGTNSMGGQGSVEAFDNVIYHVGTGPDPGSASDYGCIEVGAQVAHTNPVQIYNNSLYDCGARGNSDSGGISYHDSNIKANFVNNIFYMIKPASFQEPYFTSNSSTTACNNSTGNNNLWFGDGTPPCSSLFTSNLNVDPQFVDPVTARDFHLQASNSPPVGAGSNISTLTWDLSGLARPNPPSIGAYEFSSAGSRVNPFPSKKMMLMAYFSPAAYERFQ